MHILEMQEFGRSRKRSWSPSIRRKHPKKINAFFGEGSDFHREHGFYIDGVDENTARLPPDWTQRAIYRDVEVDGRQVFAVAPCPEDIIVSKLARLSEKDREFVEAYHAARPLNHDLIVERIKATKLDPAFEEQAIAFVGRFENGPRDEPKTNKVPD
jgi:hypothetical protein